MIVRAGEWRAKISIIKGRGGEVLAVVVVHVEVVDVEEEVLVEKEEEEEEDVMKATLVVGSASMSRGG